MSQKHTLKNGLGKSKLMTCVPFCQNSFIIFSSFSFMAEGNETVLLNLGRSSNEFLITNG